MTAPEDPFRTPPPGGSPEPTPQGYGAPPPAFGQPAYGQQPAFGQPPYGAPAGPQRNGLGTAALVLGVLGLVTCLFVIGGLFGLVAVVLGVLGRGRVKRGEADNGGLALAGIITGALALVVSIAVVAGAVALFNNGEFSNFTECVASAQTQAETDQCAADFEDSVSQ